MPDPFAALLRRDVPVAPRPGFADGLRARLFGPDRPVGLHAVTPYLCVHDAAAAIEWYREVFDARIVMEPVLVDDGRIGHVELAIGDSVLLMADEFPEIGVRAPTTIGGTPVSLVVSVADADATFAVAVAGGATSERPVAAQPYGGRAGWLIDPFGHRWNVTTTDRHPA